MARTGSLSRTHTLGRVLARELTPEDIGNVSGEGFTLTCSDQTITDCDTDECGH